jgi:DNA-binding transcriptional LysR family regulator
MNLLEIEAFLAVVRTQSLSKAANELHSAQSTISHRLKTLEQSLGTTLITRSKGTKNLRLTMIGEEFVEIAERWESLWRDTQKLQVHGPQLILSIGAVGSLNDCVLPLLYHQLSRHVPKMKLEVLTLHSVEMYNEVDKRAVDVAFVLRERDLPNVKVEQCFVHPMVVLKLNNQIHGTAILHPHDLDASFELSVGWGPLYQAWHDKWWDPLCPLRIRLNSYHQIFTFLRDQQQWAIVPLWVAQEFKKRGDFSIYEISPPPPDAICYKLTHKYPKAGTRHSLEILDHYLEPLIQKISQTTFDN